MSSFEPQVLHATFRLSQAEIAGAGDAIIGEAKLRMAEILARKLMEALMESPGGAIYSPVTFTIRPEDFDLTRVTGTINVQRLPDPDTGEFLLHDGPLNGAIIRVGSPAPKFYRLPLVRPVSVAPTHSESIAEYERVEGVQAYRFVRMW